MNKRTLILERAMLRLAEAAEAAREEQQKMDYAHIIAHRIVENDVYFFLDTDDNSLIIASPKNCKTIR